MADWTSKYFGKPGPGDPGFSRNTSKTTTSSPTTTTTGKSSGGSSGSNFYSSIGKILDAVTGVGNWSSIGSAIDNYMRVSRGRGGSSYRVDNGNVTITTPERNQQSNSNTLLRLIGALRSPVVQRGYLFEPKRDEFDTREQWYEASNDWIRQLLNNPELLPGGYYLTRPEPGISRSTDVYGRRVNADENRIEYLGRDGSVISSVFVPNLGWIKTGDGRNDEELGDVYSRNLSRYGAETRMLRGDRIGTTPSWYDGGKQYNEHNDLMRSLQALGSQWFYDRDYNLELPQSNDIGYNEPQTRVAGISTDIPNMLFTSVDVPTQTAQPQNLVQSQVQSNPGLLGLIPSLLNPGQSIRDFYENQGYGVQYDDSTKNIYVYDPVTRNVIQQYGQGQYINQDGKAVFKEADPFMVLNTMMSSQPQQMGFEELLNSIRSQYPDEPERNVLSYDEALRQARARFDPEYDNYMNEALKRVENDLIGRGFFGQLPGVAVSQDVATRINNAKASAIQDYVQQLIDRSRAEYEAERNAWLQRRDRAVDEFLRAYGLDQERQQSSLANLINVLNTVSSINSMNRQYGLELDRFNYQKEQDAWQRPYQEQLWLKEINRPYATGGGGSGGGRAVNPLEVVNWAYNTISGMDYDTAMKWINDQRALGIITPEQANQLASTLAVPQSSSDPGVIDWGRAFSTLISPEVQMWPFNTAPVQEAKDKVTATAKKAKDKVVDFFTDPDIQFWNPLQLFK